MLLLCFKPKHTFSHLFTHRQPQLRHALRFSLLADWTPISFVFISFQDFTELSKIKDDITGLKVSLNESFSNMSKEVAKDMTGTLSRVDEKVASFNKQVEDIQNSQSNFSRILAGVKQYGGLSEFSLANLLQDLLPSSQYIANAKIGLKWCPCLENMIVIITS